MGYFPVEFTWFFNVEPFSFDVSYPSISLTLCSLMNVCVILVEGNSFLEIIIASPYFLWLEKTGNFVAHGSNEVWNSRKRELQRQVIICRYTCVNITYRVSFQKNGLNTDHYFLKCTKFLAYKIAKCFGVMIIATVFLYLVVENRLLLIPVFIGTSWLVWGVKS